MFSDRGASAFLDEGDLPAALLDGASLLHVSGYSLFSETSRHAVLRLMTAATSAGVEVSVDPCSVAGLRDVGADAFLGWTKDAAVVFPNLDEGRFLSGRPSEILQPSLTPLSSTTASWLSRSVQPVFSSGRRPESASDSRPRP